MEEFLNVLNRGIEYANILREEITKKMTDTNIDSKNYLKMSNADLFNFRNKIYIWAEKNKFLKLAVEAGDKDPSKGIEIEKRVEAFILFGEILENIQ
jgi:hypothetical protein